MYYAAPEVLKGSYDEACDSWSCGAVGYLIVTGRLPIYAENEADVIHKVKQGSVDWAGAFYYPHDERLLDVLRGLLKPAHTRSRPSSCVEDPWLLKVAHGPLKTKRCS